MNQTPRLLNRAMLVIFGGVMLLVGVQLMLMAAIAEYARGWSALADGFGSSVHRILLDTTLPGQTDSWLWIIVAALLLAVILLMIWWISVQGKGRADEYISVYFDDQPLPGRVEISDDAVEQAIRAMLGRRADIISTNVSVWERDPVPGLKVKIQPRKGAAPGELGRDVVEAARETQDLLGASGPVVVYLAAGARSRFARSDRVQ